MKAFAISAFTFWLAAQRVLRQTDRPIAAARAQTTTRNKSNPTMEVVAPSAVRVFSHIDRERDVHGRMLVGLRHWPLAAEHNAASDLPHRQRGER